MVLTRWNPNAPLSPYNLVLIQQSILPFVENLSNSGSDSVNLPDNPLTPEVIQRINDRLNWARSVCENDWPPKGISDAELQNKSSLSHWMHCLTRYRGPLIFFPSVISLGFVLFRSTRKS